jgi:hypothetical protein
MICQPCRDRRHAPACDGCGCQCRAVLGLDLFEGGDPTAPDNGDRWVA